MLVSLFYDLIFRKLSKEEKYDDQMLIGANTW